MARKKGDAPARQPTLSATSVTPEEFSTWRTPKDVLSQVSEASAVAAPSSVILHHLKAAFIRSAARKASTSGISGVTVPSSGVFEIPASYWDGLTSEVHLWEAGLAKFDFRQTNTFSFESSVTCAGIRFEPSGVADLRKSLPKKKSFVLQVQPVPAPVPAEAGAAASEPEPKGPSVAASHLSQWAELYVKVYSGTDDTEERAMRSARGMFQGKTVTRHAVREVLKELRSAPKKRGRKPTAK